MGHPETGEPADDNPSNDVGFRRDLASLLNRYGIDNWAEIPDHILADSVANAIPVLRWARIATARWMGQPLLGGKLSASLPPGPVPAFWRCSRCSNAMVPGPVAPHMPPPSCSVCPNTDHWTWEG